MEASKRLAGALQLEENEPRKAEGRGNFLESQTGNQGEPGEQGQGGRAHGEL